MITTYRKVNSKSWINDTFLAPYCGYIATLMEYPNGTMHLRVNGSLIHHVQGSFTAKNGWRYTVKKLLGKPILKRKTNSK